MHLNKKYLKFLIAIFVSLVTTYLIWGHKGIVVYENFLIYYYFFSFIYFLLILLAFGHFLLNFTEKNLKM